MLALWHKKGNEKVDSSYRERYWHIRITNKREKRSDRGKKKERRKKKNKASMKECDVGEIVIKKK